MSKKKFTTGLESLFDSAGDAFQEDTVALVDTASPVPQKVRRIKARGSSKDFTSDLDSLLEDALNESVDEINKNAPDESQSGKSKERPAAPTAAHRKVLSGLDALIRQTIQVNVEEYKDETNSPTKRVTFAVDKTKLEKLKTIARQEGAYLKDIISSLISEYIREYDKGKKK